MNSENKKELAGGLICETAAAAALIFGLTSFFQPTQVKETSMQPGIQPDDRLLLRRRIGRSKLRRGDVIVFRSMEADGRGRKQLLIKRLIALPGDIVTIRDGRVFLNGEALREPYLAERSTPGRIDDLRVPDDCVFVLGDHRSVSIDSRAFGCVPVRRIRGRAFFRLFPLRKCGRL
ncbi:MAG: signal peptidase I [Anaerovoracaceae bacterium]|jgi:signal peptidase I